MLGGMGTWAGAAEAACLLLPTRHARFDVFGGAQWTEGDAKRTNRSGAVVYGAL